MDYSYFMRKAYEEALSAFKMDETPVGCVIVLDGKIIGRGFNRRNTEKNSLYHAEISAIDMACRNVGDWRLENAVLFVTVEPCPMCAGAIVQARIKEVVFGTENAKAGCAGSVLNILNHEGFNHQVIVTKGIMREECSLLMSRFFREFRERKKKAAEHCRRH